MPRSRSNKAIKVTLPLRLYHLDVSWKPSVRQTAAVLELLCKTYAHLLSWFLRSHTQHNLAVVPVVAANPMEEEQMASGQREAMGGGRPCEYSQLWLARHLQHDGVQQDEPCRPSRGTRDRPTHQRHSSVRGGTL